MLDVLTLTGLLLTAGGPSNPFSVFYLVHVALAALLLAPRPAWLVAALTSLAFGSLFVLPAHTIEPHAMHMHHGASSMHLQGMWLAYSLAAGFVVHFVSRVASALQAREHELFELQRSAVRHEKLASLSTLAAGAAHELGTPLGTIALVAKELERGLDAGSAAEALIPDARLIRQEVERCREILQQMAARAGEGAGEMLAPVSVRGVEQDLAEAARLARHSGRVRAHRGSLGARGSEAALGASSGELGAECLRRAGRNRNDRPGAGRDPCRSGARRVRNLRRWPRDRRARDEPGGRAVLHDQSSGRGLGLGVFLARAVRRKKWAAN